MSFLTTRDRDNPGPFCNGRLKFHYHKSFRSNDLLDPVYRSRLCVNTLPDDNNYRASITLDGCLRGCFPDRSKTYPFIPHQERCAGSFRENDRGSFFLSSILFCTT